MKDLLTAIFSRGSLNSTYDPLVMIGGVNNSSTTLTTDVAHFDATGNLLVNVAVGGGGGGSGTATSIVSISGTPAVNIVQWGNSNVLSASFGVPTVGWFQRLDATNDAILNYGQARTNDIAPAATNGSNTPLITDSLGKIVVLPGAVGDQHLDGHVANIASTASQTLIATPGVGRRIALQKIFVSGSGSAVSQITISGGPNNRTLGFLPATGQINLEAGGAPLYITSASTVLLIVSNVTTSFSAFASGYAMSN